MTEEKGRGRYRLHLAVNIVSIQHAYQIPMGIIFYGQSDVYIRSIYTPGTLMESFWCEKQEKVGQEVLHYVRREKGSAIQRHLVAEESPATSPMP